MRILLNGYMGSMGRVLSGLIDKDDTCEIAAGVDSVENTGGHPFPTYTDIKSCDMPTDVIIDFSIAGAVPGIVDYAVETGVPAVICTTGLSEETVEKIKLASQRVAIFKSANMSLGINLLANLLQKYAKLLDEAHFDIEIVEKHHNRKVDAPSGTALLLAEAVNQSLDGRLHPVYDRSQKRTRRSADELGIHAVRGGSIVGDHTVIFAGMDEVLEFSHSAYSREIFAVGALKAAKFMRGKGPGLYDMQDLMNAL